MTPQAKSGLQRQRLGASNRPADLTRSVGIVHNAADGNALQHLLHDSGDATSAMPVCRLQLSWTGNGIDL